MSEGGSRDRRLRLNVVGADNREMSLASVLRETARSAYHRIVRALPDYWAIQVMYVRHFGKPANLKHPRTYNEKINWRKLYQRDPRFVLFSDKIAVKQEVSKIIGGKHIIPILWEGYCPRDIPFAQLTPPYVIKVNHSNGNHIFIRTRDDIDNNAIFRSLEEQLRSSYGHKFREWGYCGITRKIFVEPFVEGRRGGVPEDYKFFVYGGRVHFILVVTDRFGDYRENYYDRDWIPLPVKCIHPAGVSIPPPLHLSEMISIAEKIGALFDYVRVDLYDAQEGIFFGETTFYDGAGYEKLSPDEWELKFGEPWKIGQH